MRKYMTPKTILGIFMITGIFTIPACLESPKEAQMQTTISSEGEVTDKTRFDSPYHTSLNTTIKGEKCWDLQLIDDEGKTIQLADLLKHSQPKLIFRFSGFDCDLCYKQVLEICNRLDSLYAKDLLVVGTFESDREFRLLKATYAPKLRFLNIKSTRPLNTTLDALDKPYFCKVDENLNISNVYLPDKKYPGHTREYVEGHFKRK
ncbi:hypothetical protein [Anseongella ginsenosidimutans]|uniref:hypothetical protein n=1 Tax=Anseongella ginsenosidimutans TaxID=496056 RepID=UPI001049105E|nr:hypothetical protein [Anseongella ginsenosidimutans]